MVAGSPVELKPYLESGKVKPLAVLDSKRSPHLPNVPTVTDDAQDCPPVVTYNGLLGPAQLPKEVVETLSRELVAAGKSQEFRQRLLNVGLEPLLSTPEEFAKIIAADAAQWNRIMPGPQHQEAIASPQRDDGENEGKARASSSSGRARSAWSARSRSTERRAGNRVRAGAGAGRGPARGVAAPAHAGDARPARRDARRSCRSAWFRAPTVFTTGCRIRWSPSSISACCGTNSAFRSCCNTSSTSSPPRSRRSTPTPPISTCASPTR